MKNVTVKQVLDEIEGMSEFIFFYQDAALDVYRKVSVDVNKETVERILDHVLRGTDNTYFVSDRSIYILKENSSGKTDLIENLIAQQEKEELPGIEAINLNRRLSRGFNRPGEKRASHDGQTVVALNKRTSVILEQLDPNSLTPEDKSKLSKQLTRAMNLASKEWNFELAAQIRDTIAKLE